ncbi:uncharacterized protein LOC144134915 isoform X3 [Amblyomma americanum]
MSSPGPAGGTPAPASPETRAATPTKPSPFSVASLLADTRPSGQLRWTAPAFAAGILHAAPRDPGLPFLHGPVAGGGPFGWALHAPGGTQPCGPSWFGLAPHHALPSEDLVPEPARQGEAAQGSRAGEVAHGHAAAATGRLRSGPGRGSVRRNGRCLGRCARRLHAPSAPHAGIAARASPTFRRRRGRVGLAATAARLVSTSAAAPGRAACAVTPSPGLRDGGREGHTGSVQYIQ